MKKFILQLDLGQTTFSVKGAQPEAMVKWAFNDIDQKKFKVDAILLETHYFFPSESPTNTAQQYLEFKNRNIDIAKIIIDAAHQRGIEILMHHRICDADSGCRGKTGKDGYNPIKLEHPDWVIKTWWKEGMWNFAAEGLRKFKTDYISDIMHQYDFDGVCIDFSRHTPFLPVGRQWELRECVTDFMRGIKDALSDIENIKIGAKVPENQKACKIDGFDIEKWTAEELVDFYVLGSRSITVEVDWYKKITEGKNISLYPCWDSWHSTDAYHRQKEDFFRALFSNWAEKGADGVVVFNSSPTDDKNISLLNDNVRKEALLKYAYTKVHYDAYLEYSDIDKERKYVVERRGGYPYSTGSMGTNEFAPLPCVLANYAAPSDIPIEINSDYKGKSLKLSVIISGAKEDIDNFEISVNGSKVENLEYNHSFIDEQIFYPKPQNPSGGSYCTTDEPSNLLNLTAKISGDILNYGVNTVSIAVIDRTDYNVGEDINIERVEVFYE